MENIYKSNISVIQGPPGTGKTQTILNIIVNLAIMQNKTVAVVSNNNEAVKNVKDKLKKRWIWFYCCRFRKYKEKRAIFREDTTTQCKKFQGRKWRRITQTIRNIKWKTK